MDPKEEKKNQDQTEEEAKAEAEYSEAWDKADETDDDPADPEGGAAKGEPEDEGLPGEDSEEEEDDNRAPEDTGGEPEGKESPAASREHGSLEAMEKAVKDTRSYAMKLKSQVDELQAKVKEYEEGTATEGDVDKARKAVEEARDDYDKVREDVYSDYPELKNLLDPIIEGNRAMREEIKDLKEDKQKNEALEARNKAVEHFETSVKPKVMETHSDFEDIISREETDDDGNTKRVLNEEYLEWAKNQRPGLRTAALESDDPDDIIEAVTEYKKFKASGDAPELKKKQKAERKRKLLNAQSLRGGSAPMPTGKGPDQDDYNAGWDEAGRELKKEGVG